MFRNISVFLFLCLLYYSHMFLGLSLIGALLASVYVPSKKHHLLMAQGANICR